MGRYKNIQRKVGRRRHEQRRSFAQLLKMMVIGSFFNFQFSLFVLR
jgi:hypothetical protein